eukprot:7390203-Prymnesium_polylepis.1
MDANPPPLHLCRTLHTCSPYRWSRRENSTREFVRPPSPIAKTAESHDRLKTCGFTSFACNALPARRRFGFEPGCELGPSPPPLPP